MYLGSSLQGVSRKYCAICVGYIMYIYVVGMYLVVNAINFDDNVISKHNSRKEGIYSYIVSQSSEGATY